LEGKGFEHFLATYRTQQKGAAHERRARALPLFPGYVFARFLATSRLPILIVPGVIGIVGFNGVPAAIPEDQMNAVRELVRACNTVGPWPFLANGDRVRIVHGPLAGIEGFLLDTRNCCRMVVSIDLLQRSVSAEIDRSWVYPLRQSQHQT
jgi:transcription antitermination factor NusG